MAATRPLMGSRNGQEGVRGRFFQEKGRFEVILDGEGGEAGEKIQL